nr:UvrD-helicase domain-containing protein [uncultured Dethiosulfovibrio sp.]
MTTRTGDMDQGLKWLSELVEGKTLKAQAEAITAEEPTVVVSAGAGTGKTWTLAWRFLWAVATGRAKAGEILTLTFTDKAATEMADRIRALMTTVLSMASGHRSIELRLKAALEELDDGYISTIHSFASRVIKESGLSLDLDPASRVVSSPEEDLFWNQMVDVLDRLDGRWIGSNLSGETRKTALAILEDRLTRIILATYSPASVISFARGLMDISSSRGDGPQTLWNWAENLEDRHEEVRLEVLKVAHHRWAEIYEVWFGPMGIFAALDLDSNGTQLADRLRGLKDRWKVFKEDMDLPAFLSDLSECIKNARGKLADSIALMLPERSVKAHRDGIKDQSFLWDLSLTGWSRKELDLTSGLLRIGGLCWHCWEARKSGRGLIAFDDMILRAGEVLERERDYSNRFKEIMVDEFQDTNGLQDRLIRSMSDGKRLFLVGDLKQSIYRFRHADLSLFGGYIQEVRKGGGRYVSLDVSFRTRDELIHRINDLFSKVWKDGLGRSLPHLYEELRPPVDQDWHKLRQEVSVPPLELLLTYPEKKTSAEEKRNIAMELLSNRLSSLVGEATVWDKSAGKTGPLRWRDVAILVPSRAIFPAIQRVLGGRGIPLHFEKNTSYYARTEVQDSVALLKYLSDPDDMLSLAGFLSSPLSGIPLRDAQDLVFKGAALGERLAEGFPGLWKKLERWRITGRVKGASAVMEELVADGSILERFADWKRSGVAANLRRTVDLLREYESTVGSGLSGASGWLADAMKRKAKEEEAGSVGPDEDVVKVMTIHGSKGLEFPMVVLAGCDGRRRGFPQALLPSIHLGAALSDDLSLSRKVHRFLDDEEEEEEGERLFYVGCTRARDSLILVGTGEPADGSWLKTAMNHGFMEWAATELTGGPSAGDEPVSAERGPVIGSPAKPGGLDRLSPSSWALFRHCPHGWRLRFRQAVDLSWEAGDGSDPGGADLGTLTHWLLARWDFSVEGKKGVDRLLAWDRSLLPPDLRPLWAQVDVRSSVESWLTDLAKGPDGGMYRELLREGRLRREVPFRVPLDDGPLLVGAVDLMWEEGGKVFIRDYKTTGVDSDVHRLYDDQLRLYGLAVHLGMETDSVDMALCLLREGGKELSVDLAPFGSWGDLEEAVRADALSAASGPWSRSVDFCDSCPFRRVCRGY